jgi:hypothetical protein
MTIINSYIPILRWKLAEKKALEQIFQQDRGNLTPLIEFIMPAATTKKQGDEIVITKTSKEKLTKMLSDVTNDLLKSCGQDTVFIDDDFTIKPVELIDNKHNNSNDEEDIFSGLDDLPL